MDRLSSYTSWLVNSCPKDEVPVGHTLTGFVTAFDFLHDRFDEETLEGYMDKIKTEADKLYAVYKDQAAGWTHQHIHNHAATVVLSMLQAALVYEPVDAAVGVFVGRRSWLI